MKHAQFSADPQPSTVADRRADRSLAALELSFSLNTTRSKLPKPTCHDCVVSWCWSAEERDSTEPQSVKRGQVSDGALAVREEARCFD